MADTVDDLLAQSGATLQRNKRHEVWRLPNGKAFTRATTPSDARAEKNQASDLRNLLGVSGRGKPAANGERRVKKPKKGQKHHHQPLPPPNTAMADALRKVGVVEDGRKGGRKMSFNDKELGAIYMAFAVSLQAYDEHKKYLALGCPKRAAAEEIENVKGIEDRARESLRSDPLFYRTVQHAMMMAREYKDEDELIRAEEEIRRLTLYGSFSAILPLDHLRQGLIDQARAEVKAEDATP